MIETDKWAFCHIPKNGGTNFTTRSPHKPDKKFNNSSRLIKQMNKDVILAKKGLKGKLVI